MTKRQAGGQQNWTEADIPDWSGRTAVITGANAGLGLQAARVLAARGAHVVSHNEAGQARLWQVSERLTGVGYPVLS